MVLTVRPARFAESKQAGGRGARARHKNWRSSTKTIQGGMIKKPICGLIGLAVFGLFLIGLSQATIGQQAYQSGDPFANLPAETLDCLKKVLGESRYNEIRAGSPMTVEEPGVLSASGCFGTQTTVGQTEVVPVPPEQNPFSTMLAEERGCMIDTLGESRFNELAGGAAFTEADNEALRTSGCFTKKAKIGEETIVPAKVNMFNGLDQSMQDCLRGALGEDYDKLAGGTAFTDEHEKKARACFKPLASGDQAGAGMEPELKACVERVLGKERFEELDRGAGQIYPTPAEEEEMKTECFKDKYAVKNYEAERGVSAETMKCVKLAIGAERMNDLKSGKVEPNDQDRNAFEGCMGKHRSPIAPPPELVMSKELKDCLIKAVGEQRFNEIKSGSEPNEEEKKAGQACFDQFEKTVKNKTIEPEKILPPPSEKVTFLEEDPTTIKIDAVTASKDGQLITLAGTASKSGVPVDVYVYSEPKQLTVTAKGSIWSVTYDGELPTGDHIAYAVTKKAGENVRSPKKVFDLKTAQGEAASIAAPQTGQTPAIAQIPTPTVVTQVVTESKTRLLLWILNLGGVALLVVLIGLLLRWGRGSQ